MDGSGEIGLARSGIKLALGRIKPAEKSITDYGLLFQLLAFFCMKSSQKSLNPSTFCRHKIHQASSKNYRVIKKKLTNLSVGSINKIQPQIVCLITYQPHNLRKTKLKSD